MKKTALIVMIVTILSKILGFGREMVLSYVYGASAISDAYLISQTIPAVIFSFVSVGIATGYIPLYSRILSEHGKIEPFPDNRTPFRVLYSLFLKFAR